MVLKSEQYENRDCAAWFPDLLGTAAIWFPRYGTMRVEDHGRGRGFVCVKCGMVTYFSCYITPNEAIHEYKEKLDALEDAILNIIDGDVIDAGDFSAWTVEWGMHHTNTWSRRILEMAARAGLVVLNVGTVPTFRRTGCAGTIPDISLASERLVSRIKAWQVIEHYTGSDHQFVLFEVHEISQLHRKQQEPPRK